MSLSLRQHRTERATSASLEADQSYFSTVAAIDGLDDAQSTTFTVKRWVEVGKQRVLHSEKYSVYQDDSRTAELLAYLDTYGIPADDVSSYIGRRERLTFGYEFRRNRLYLNIIEKEMVDTANQSQDGDET